MNKKIVAKRSIIRSMSFQINEYLRLYLCCLDITCHVNVTWKCAQLLNKEDNFPNDLEDLRRKISQSYRCEARDVVCRNYLYILLNK